jgi:hypothetical protein
MLIPWLSPTASGFTNLSVRLSVPCQKLFGGETRERTILDRDHRHRAEIIVESRTSGLAAGRPENAETTHSDF